MPSTREVTAWYDFSGRYDNIRSEYRPGTRDAFVQEVASFVSFSDLRVQPARRRHDNKGPPAGSCRFEKGGSAQARSAGSARGSAKNNSRVMDF